MFASRLLFVDCDDWRNMSSQFQTRNQQNGSVFLVHSWGRGLFRVLHVQTFQHFWQRFPQNFQHVFVLLLLRAVYLLLVGSGSCYLLPSFESSFSLCSAPTIFVETFRIWGVCVLSL